MSTDSGNRKYQALALGTSYALGTFNDNFFKQAGLLLAVTTGNAVFQSQVTFLFALPFVLFSAWSGWLADRFAKKSLVICAKTLELAAMLAGAWGMVTLDWNWMLAMTFCMGLSSTLFSPALNGSIPELFPVGQVPRINALFKLGTTASILFGVFLAGIALDQAWIETAYPFGRWLVAILAVTVAAGGLVSTAFIPAYPGAGSRNPFPWSAVIDSFRFLRTLRKDGPLHLVIWAEAFFYFLSTLLLLEINNLGGAELGLSYTATSCSPPEARPKAGARCWSRRSWASASCCALCRSSPLPIPRSGFHCCSGCTRLPGRAAGSTSSRSPALSKSAPPPRTRGASSGSTTAFLSPASCLRANCICPCHCCGPRTGMWSSAFSAWALPACFWP